MEPQGKIGFQRIHALLLKLIGTQLVDQTDAPAFLPHIKQDAPAFFFDLCHGGGQLLAAIATQRTKCISCQAFRVDAAQNILSIANVTFYQCNVMLSVQAAHKTISSEGAILGGQVHCRHLIDQFIVTLAVLL